MEVEQAGEMFDEEEQRDVKLMARLKQQMTAQGSFGV